MTETEARTKWCPFARSYDVESYIEGLPASTINRDGNGKAEYTCLCIASDCMAWRWHFKTDAASQLSVPSGNGHCGLAGNER